MPILLHLFFRGIKGVWQKFDDVSKVLLIAAGLWWDVEFIFWQIKSSK